MKEFDLFSLKLFVAVCDAGSIQSVGEREHIDPSAITKRLTKLEKDLGVKLLDKSAKGITPTTEGKGLLHGSRSLLAHANQLADHMRDFQVDIEDTIEIIATPSAWSGFLSYDIAEFLGLAKHKQVNVVMREDDTLGIAAAINEGRASIGVSWNSKHLKGLNTIPYRQQMIAAFLHKSHLLSSEKKVSFEQANKFDRIAIPSNRIAELELASKQSIITSSMKFRAIAPNFEIALRFVEKNIGLLLAPYEMRLFVQSPQIAVVPLIDESAYRDYVVCFKDETTLSTGARLLIKFLSNINKS